MIDRIDDADVARFGIAAMISPNALLPTEEWLDLDELTQRLENGTFFEDYDEDVRLMGVLRKHVDAMRALAKPDEGVK